MTHTGLVARVLIDSPLPQLDHLFDYAIPAELADVAQPGVRVKVPFGSSGRVVGGYLIERVEPATDDAAPAVAGAAAGGADAGGAGAGGAGAGGGADPLFHGTLSPLESVVSPARVLTGEVWTLARAVADRSAGNAGDVIRLAVPPRRVRVEKAWLAQPADAADTAGGKAAACHFADYPAGALTGIIAQRGRAAVAAVPRPVLLADGRTVGQWALTLAELGVAALAAGRSAILAVPDYRDQDQLQAALAQLAPAGSVRRVDARQSDPDRYRDFLACLDPVPRIIIGNRSAVYAPAHELGLIALWDDGDPLYAEPLSPYVHARDAALVRQQQADCALVFLGHARSVEVQRLVGLGWLQSIEPARAQHPRVIPTELQATDARGARIPSAAWGAAREALARGPVLVQVASPGYAPVLACTTCRHAARCTRCQGPLGLAAADAAPSCRWCGALAVGWHCPLCEGTEFRLVTVGSGRTAEELGRAFPGVRVIVADGDHIVQRVDAAPALVIATRGAEPLAHGGYQAVLLLDGERMLARESLRVGEDCLRWWSNAAALAAPGAPVMLVGVGGVLARTLSLWQQPRYAAAELADRRSLRFPPALRAASVTGAAPAVEAALDGLTGIDGVDVLGPVGADEGSVRAIVRLPYAAGDQVAHALKAAVVRAATGRRPAKGRGYRPPPTLKVRFDDPELL